MLLDNIIASASTAYPALTFLGLSGDLCRSWKAHPQLSHLECSMLSRGGTQAKFWWWKLFLDHCLQGSAWHLNLSINRCPCTQLRFVFWMLSVPIDCCSLAHMWLAFDLEIDDACCRATCSWSQDNKHHGNLSCEQDVKLNINKTYWMLSLSRRGRFDRGPPSRLEVEPTWNRPAFRAGAMPNFISRCVCMR